MIITDKTWNRYISVLRQLNNRAAEDMIRYLAKQDYVDIDGTYVLTTRQRKELIDYAYGVSTKYGEGAAAAACEMYDAIAVLQKASVEPAVPAATATYNEVGKAVNGTLKQNPDLVPSTVSRLVKTAGADTTLKNAIRDDAYWAWVPQGDTCAFCITLASRGWQKASEKALKGGHAEHIHSNCDCTYAIRFAPDLNVEGYDPQVYKDMYDEAEGSTAQQKINAMRRQFYAENKATVGTGSLAEEFISKATNRTEAYNTLQTMFGSISDNVKNIDEKLLIENVNELKALNDKYKILKNDNFGYFTSRTMGQAVAYTSGGYTNNAQRINLGLSSGCYKSEEKLRSIENRSRKSFFSMPFADNKINVYSLTHEYGHMLQSTIATRRTDWKALEEKRVKLNTFDAEKIRNIYKKEEKKQAKAMYEEITAIAKKNNPNFSLKDNLSEYGRTNYNEFFAESFANSRCGAPNELGIAMEEWLEKEGF